MSFLGSTGSLMEDSGLRAALESVYAQLTVGHMFSGKAYACALPGYMLCARPSFLYFWKNPSIQN